MKEQIIKEITEKVMVKLEAHKVELSNIKELETKIKTLTSIQNELDKIYVNLNKWKEQQKDKEDKLNVFMKESKSVLSKFQSLAKDLGLSADDVSQYKLLKKLISISKSEYLK